MNAITIVSVALVAFAAIREAVMDRRKEANRVRTCAVKEARSVASFRKAIDSGTVWGFLSEELDRPRVTN